MMELTLLWMILISKALHMHINAHRREVIQNVQYGSLNCMLLILILHWLKPFVMVDAIDICTLFKQSECWKNNFDRFVPLKFVHLDKI